MPPADGSARRLTEEDRELLMEIEEEAEEAKRRTAGDEYTSQ